MTEPLYLDTARLGLMASSAQQLHTAFARLASDPRGLLYFMEFLQDGYAALPAAQRELYPGLKSWQGTSGLAFAAKQLMDATDSSDALFANRSATLMKVAALNLASRCRHIVTVDQLWAPYRRVLTAACRATGANLSVVRLRRHLLSRQASPAWIKELVVESCHRTRARGLVLPVLSHRGVRLPIDSILKAVQPTPQVVVLDAAQALGHVPFHTPTECPSFIISGTHKWLGSYWPLGLAISTDPAIAQSVPHLLLSRQIEDPLLQLCCESQGLVQFRHGETASVPPLVSAHGAILEALDSDIRQQLAIRLRNRRRLLRLIRGYGWRQVGPRMSTTHGILVVKPPAAIRQQGPQPLRRALRECEVVATVYPDCCVRLALPAEPIEAAAERQLVRALGLVGCSIVVSKDFISCTHQHTAFGDGGRRHSWGQ